MSRDTLRVLLVEDSAEDAELLVAELCRGGYVPLPERVYTATLLRGALDQGPWDLVIADYRMPQFTGLQALSIIKERGLDLPFILVSGAVGEDVAVEAMKAGAHDYVMKDKLARLVPAVRRELAEAEVRRNRRKAEENLKKAYEDLEDRVRLRTAELSQANARLREELEERRRLEEDRNRMFVRLLRGQKLQAIGQLAAGVAHEINNPSGWILSNLGAMEKYFQKLAGLVRDMESAVKDRSKEGPQGLVEAITRLQEKADADFILKDFASAVRDSKDGALRIRDIVASLKTFSHPDEKEPERADLAQLLDSAIRLCAGELKYKAKLVRSFAPVSPILCRPQQMEQVFVNLLVNAAQAIPDHGEIHVSIAEEGGQAVVRIRDTGTGISPEHLKRLFEPFFTTKPVGKGTGLGLHVAYKIVRAHDGSIKVESKLDQGTEVTVRLPSSGHRSELPSNGQEASGSGKPVVILVDDDEATLRVLRRVLSREPIRLLSTKSPRKALEWVRSKKVHLILSDHRMPEMSGESLLGEVARQSPDTRRVLLTAYPESPQIGQAQGAIDAVITKPWDEKTLSQAVRKYIGMIPEEKV